MMHMLMLVAQGTILVIKPLLGVRHCIVHQRVIITVLLWRLSTIAILVLVFNYVYITGQPTTNDHFVY